MFDETDPSFDHELEPTTVTPSINPRTMIFALILALAALVGSAALVRAYGQEAPSSSSSSSEDAVCQTVLDYTAFLAKHGITPTGHVVGQQARSFLSHLTEDDPVTGNPPAAANEVYFIRGAEWTGIAVFGAGCFIDDIKKPTSVVDKALDEAAGI